MTPAESTPRKADAPTGQGDVVKEGELATAPASSSRRPASAPATWSSTLLAGSSFGYTLMWAAVIGCLVKISLAEATGRWHLATGRTIFEGWRSLGAWTTVYFAVYVVVWGFVYGATAMSSSALPLVSLFPGGPGLKTWAVVTGLLGLLVVWFGRYAVVEKVMMVFVGVMFVVVVFVAVRVGPDCARRAGRPVADPAGRLGAVHHGPRRRRRRHDHHGRLRLLGERQGLDQPAGGSG